MHRVQWHILEMIAEGFADLRPRIVFVGGATLPLYATDSSAFRYTQSQGVDCVMKEIVESRYGHWDEKLKQYGFELESSPYVPVQQWKYRGIQIQLGAADVYLSCFQNRWYEDGFFHARPFRLPSGTPIRIFNPVYFLATKIEAFMNRGRFDFRKSEDFEDIVYLLDNRPEIHRELAEAFHDVRTFVQKSFKRFLAHPGLEEGIAWTLPHGSGEERIFRILQLIQDITVDLSPVMEKSPVPFP